MAGRCGLSAVLRLRIAGVAIAAGAVALAASAPGCTSGASGTQAVCPPNETCQVSLTLLHTS
jgi:hypothetical protein